MKEAELPDGTILEFPADTPDEVIQRAVRQQLASSTKPVAPKNQPGKLTSLAAGIGQGLANTVLGAQDLFGRIMQMAGPERNEYSSGDFMQQPSQTNVGSVGAAIRQASQRGKQSMQSSTAIYEQANPLTFSAGKVGGEILSTLPVGGIVARPVQMAASGLSKTAPAVSNVANNLATAIRSGGATGGNLPTRMVGGAIAGGSSSGLINADDASTGAAIGASIPAAGKVLRGAFGLISPERLMQSALKPTLAQQQSGEAKAAIDTLLKYGINATQEGSDQLKSMINDIDDQIYQALSKSDARIAKKDVLKAINDARSKFANQVTPQSDIDAINKVADEFSSHPVFAKYGAKKQELETALKKSISEKQTALQAAGKLKTFAAQQEALAQGDVLNLARKQTENQPYFNIGDLGKKVISPSAYPVLGYPRAPARYTNNIDRVPEGLQGYEEAMQIYGTKKADQATIEKALSDFTEQGPFINAQEAQRLKQGTYKMLEKKYGQLGTAEVEAQKALARGLKEQIAKEVPDVVPLNDKQSNLIKALKVTSRRSMMDDNRNPVGISGLSTNPGQLALMLADRSALVKSLAARGIKNLTPEENNFLVNALRLGAYRSAPVIGTGE